MKAQIKISDLASALARLKIIVSRKTTLPILGNVLIEAGKAGLTVTGTDLDTFLTLEVAADVEKPGAVTVPCGRLAAALGKMEGETLDLTSSQARLNGKSGAMRFELLGLDPKEFPPRPVIDGGAVQTFDEGLIADALARSLSCVSDDETRYVLNGVHLASTGGHLSMIATDGRRLAVTTTAGAAKDHLPAWADAIEASDAEAVGFRGTSVAENPWFRYDEEKDEDIPRPMSEGFEVYDWLASLAGRAAAADSRKASSADRTAFDSSAWVGTGAGQTLARPTAAGWWWWRNRDAWTMVRVMECPSGLYCLDLNMADEKAAGCLPFRRWLGGWAGPLVPPPVPTDEISRETGC